MRTALSTLLFVCFLTGCEVFSFLGSGDRQDHIGTVGEAIELKIGDRVTIEEAGLVLTFERLVEDSRCPFDVVCFWEGRGVIRVVLAFGDSRESADLTTHGFLEGDADHVDRKGYRIRFVELKPYPASAGSISHGQYRAVMKVERLEG